MNTGARHDGERTVHFTGCENMENLYERLETEAMAWAEREGG